MISPKEIRQKVERWWPEVLRSAQTQNAFFPKEITRIGKVKSAERLRDFERIRQAQDALLTESKKRKGYGYMIHWTSIQARNVGHNQFIDRISFETLEDYLRFCGKTKIWQQYQADWQLITQHFPELRDWCLEKPKEIVSYQGLWPDLIKVLEYFKKEYRPHRFYIRELPISIPTKFIESHKAILTPLLDCLLPSDFIQEQHQGIRNFEQRYGLRYQEPLIRMRLLDQQLAQKHFSGLQDWSIPLSDFEQLSLPLKKVIVLENKTSYNNLLAFLTLPQLQATAGIFGSGFKVGSLNGAQWLHEVELYYWGDIDAHGLQILSQIRSHFPHTQALMMDRSTFEAFPDYQVTAPKSTAGQLTHLSPTEQQLFDYLNHNSLRLEQERIPLDWVRRALQAL